MSRWVVRRAGSEGEGVPTGVDPSTGGLDNAQVRAIVEDSLLGAHTPTLRTAHHTPPEGGADQTARDAATAAQTAADGAQATAGG